ncbi:MAG: transcription termination factor NusA [Candidatus Roseilinea sp.]|uniref:transcription termination factor NusA n=1 Tax=Candidatus Roseilinea sp. TaxID=2838777 RepID=UPI004049457A
MKSEFTLALNQICSERNLPKEIITQVLESALATSYRKNANIMNSQRVAVKVDIDSGDTHVFVEKEVVENVVDDRTEVSLEEARLGKADAEIGDCIMVDVTPKDFDRIAAQNVKQMIVQKLREAERDFQYNSFAEREGEIVYGIVHNVTPNGVVLNLGRVEGILPRKEQIPGERVELQQRMRAYVTEVKRSNRGPQIMLSRAHRNMLRRLLEIEVPEISKGQVEIKSIAREPGARSKVAVAALQAGIDPVGACVGQRGARIQNIVNELNGEKIDVIEWSEDPTTYITKSLGPAKVLAVHPNKDSKTNSATVIVPDDQLSLAIGREGQNARLAAKLTGWHIDIKSGSEALSESLAKIAEDEKLQQWIGADIAQTIPAARELLVRQRAVPAPLNPEEFLMVKRIVDALYEYATTQGSSAATAQRAATRPGTADTQRQDAHQAALERIPRAAYAMPVEKLELTQRVLQHITSAGILSVGDLMERRLSGDEGLLSIEGIGAKALSEIKLAMDKVLGAFASPQSAGRPASAEATAPASTTIPQDAAHSKAQAPATPNVADAAPASSVTGVESVAHAGTAVTITAQPATAGAQQPGAAAAQPTMTMDDDGRSPQEIFLEAMAEEEEDERRPSPSTQGARRKADKDKGRKGARDRVLIYDEELGRTVVQRMRKPGREGFIDDIEEE